MATKTSNGTGGGAWSAGSTWVGGVKPADGDSVVIDAGDAVLMDEDQSAWTGLFTVTITGAAVTPGMLYWKAGTSGYLKIRTGYNLVGTSAAVKGRLLANNSGIWGETAPLPFANKAAILLQGTSKIDATYLDIALRCTHPANWFARTYKTAYTCTNQQTDINPATDTITFTGAPPANDTPVTFTSTGSYPGGIETNRTYYTCNVSGNTCRLRDYMYVSASLVDITSTGSGTLTMYDGHTNTATKTINVVENLTADTPWTTAAGQNRVALVDIAPEAADWQRDTLATINAGSLVFTTANINSVQFPFARVYLISRNVRIQSTGTTGNQPIVDYGSATHTGVLDCEISNTSSLTSNYGYGLFCTSTATLHSFPGILSAALYGVYCRSDVTGAIVTCTSGSLSQSAVPTASTVSGTIAGCTTGCECNTPTVSGLIIGCTRALKDCIAASISGTIWGCQYAMINGYNNSLETTGLIHGCADACDGLGHTISGTIRGCAQGCDATARCLVLTATGTVTGCSYGFYGGINLVLAGTLSRNQVALYGCNAILNASTFTANQTDIAVENACVTGYGVTLTSNPPVSTYLHGLAGLVQIRHYPSGCFIQDYAGTAGAVAAWSPGGSIITETWNESTHDPLGQISPNPATVEHLTAASPTAIAEIAIPFRARAGQTVTVTVKGYRVASANWIQLPTYAIVDPTKPYLSAAANLDVETQHDDSDWHTYTLTYTPAHDRTLQFVIRSRGGNADAGQYCHAYILYDISTGSGGIDPDDIVDPQYVLEGHNNYTDGEPGTLTIPNSAHVLTAAWGGPVTYGVAGTGSEPTATLTAAANVWYGSGAFGVNGSSIIPTKRASSIPNCAPDNVKTDVTIDDVTGTYSPGGTYAEGQAAQLAIDQAAVLADADHVELGVTILGQAGALDTSAIYDAGYANGNAAGQITGAAAQLADDQGAVEAAKAGISDAITLLGVPGALDLSLYTLINGITWPPLDAVDGGVKFGPVTGMEYEGQGMNAETLLATLGLAEGNLDEQFASASGWTEEERKQLRYRLGIDGDESTPAENTPALGPLVLTVPAAELAAALAGSTVTLHRGDTLTFTLTGLGNLSDRTRLWFTGKDRSADADLAAQLLMEETTGLQVLAGETPQTEEEAAIVVDDEVAGDVTITISAAASKKLDPTTTGIWDVQMRDAAGRVTTLAQGALKIVADVTQRIE